MREIKFRFWDTEHCEMRAEFLLRELILIENMSNEDVDSVVAMQFTGLKDKNGVEIYEGDLLKIYDNRNGYLQVEFVNSYVGGWVLTHPESVQKLSLGARAQNTIEVVGNIYENPELLNI